MKTWEEKKIKYLEILENTNKTIEEIMTIDATRKNLVYGINILG